MSTLRCTNLQDTSGGNSLTTAQIYNGAAKAWVNFNGTGVVAMRANFNVSSITDNAEGDYTINFTTALTDANYTATFMLGRDTTNIDVSAAVHPTTLPTSSALRIRTAFTSQVGQTLYADLTRIMVSVFR